MNESFFSETQICLWLSFPQISSRFRNILMSKYLIKCLELKCVSFTRWLPIDPCRGDNIPPSPSGVLTFRDLGGLFLLLAACVLLSVCLGVFEYCYLSSSRANKQKNMMVRSEEPFVVKIKYLSYLFCEVSVIFIL